MREEGTPDRDRHRLVHRGRGCGRDEEYDIVGLKMNDGGRAAHHPTGKAILKLSVKSQGQGHETTFAQIVAEEIGYPAR